MLDQSKRIVGLFLVCVMLCAGVAAAAEKKPGEEGLLTNLLTAIQNDDFGAFVADATPEVKGRLSARELTRISAQLSPRMKKGYSKVYLGELKQHGLHVHLWKLTFSDGGDDILARLVTKDHKVIGFWLQ